MPNYAFKCPECGTRVVRQIEMNARDTLHVYCDNHTGEVVLMKRTLSFLAAKVK